MSSLPCPALLLCPAIPLWLTVSASSVGTSVCWAGSERGVGPAAAAAAAAAAAVAAAAVAAAPAPAAAAVVVAAPAVAAAGGRGGGGGQWLLLLPLQFPQGLTAAAAVPAGH